ncbi:MAG: hypothetical protein WBV33_06715, partial [Terracidiphilus sp.]
LPPRLKSSGTLFVIRSSIPPALHLFIAIWLHCHSRLSSRSLQIVRSHLAIVRHHPLALPFR